MMQIRVRNERQDERFDHRAGALEFGRAASDSGKRFVVEDRYVSREQLRLTEIGGGRARIENLGNSITLSDGTVLEKNEHRVVVLPVNVQAGYTTITIESSTEASSIDESLQTITRPRKLASRDEPLSSLAALGESPDPATLANWFETVLSVQRAAAGSNEFYDETARAVVDLVGLDRGLVVLRSSDEVGWQVMANFFKEASDKPPFSRSVLQLVLEQRRTFFQSFEGMTSAASLMQVEAVVASPILDDQDQVVGAVYGSRDLRANQQRRGIQPLEAQVVQLLAGAVSAGLARLQKEAEAARMRVQFEQFSSPELARELELNPRLLDGSEREITVLFCDLRGFSRISERLGARETYRLVGDVMDALTNKILEHRGVIIDYYGDGIAAMWNAPTEQPDHRRLACQAARTMRAALADVDLRWQSQLNGPLVLGVGIHSGTAQVGNAGSRRRLKYGPRGHTVNLASRLEGTTKVFQVPIVVSESAQQALVAAETRRLAKIQVKGVEQAIDVFQLRVDEVDDRWSHLRDTYETALQSFEQGQFDAATQTLAALDAATQQSDGPTRLLLERIQEAQTQDVAEAVLRLDAK